jgi:hypothetical protein
MFHDVKKKEVFLWLPTGSQATEMALQCLLH